MKKTKEANILMWEADKIQPLHPEIIEYKNIILP